MGKAFANQTCQRSALTILISASALSGFSISALGAEVLGSNSPWMTGDWGGVRSDLLRNGVDVQAGYTIEAASNLDGGYSSKRVLRYADQFTLGVNIDLNKMTDWENTLFSFQLTNRNGQEGLNKQIDDPRAASYSYTQEIQGLASITRVSELWLSKGWFADKLNIKLGRFGVSDEFAVEDCIFQGLAFCGSQPGNYSDTIYNGPLSQWAARVKFNIADDIYAQVGAFDVNPDNAVTTFRLRTSGTIGTLVPVELVWSPKPNQLPGEYRIGYFHSTANGTDVYKDVNNKPAALTGEEYRARSNRQGFWLVGKQQLTTVGSDADRGLTMTASATFQDRNTTPIDSYQKVSFLYKGPFDARTKDTLGFGIARMHYSSLFLRNAKVANDQSGLAYDDQNYVPQQHTEYQMELNYGIQAAPWLKIMPNLQYLRHPNGVREVDDALVMGLQVSTVF